MAFQPTDLSGLALWLNAESLSLSDGASVSSWIDSGPSGYILYQNIPSRMPTYVSNATNGRAAVNFQASAFQCVTGINNIGVNNFTSFCVFRSASQAPQTVFSNSRYTPPISTIANYMFVLNNTSSASWNFISDNQLAFGDEFFLSTNITPTGEWIIRGDSYNGNQSLYMTRNGLPYASGDTSNMTTILPNSDQCRIAVGTTLFYAPTGTLYMDGQISEIILYNRKISQSEETQVADYLKFKYFVSAYGSPMFLYGPSSTGVSSAYNSANLSLFNTSSLSSGVNLYAVGNDVVQSGANLIVTASDSSVSGVNLYVSGVGFSSNLSTLYMGGFDIVYSGVSLYAGGSIVSASGANLYTTGFDVVNSGVNMTIVGPPPATGYAPMFVSGVSVTPMMVGGADLFTMAGVARMGADLNVAGMDVGATGVNLYTVNALGGNNSATMFMPSVAGSGQGMSLFLKQIPPPSSYKTADLFVFSATTPTIYDVFSLYTKSYPSNGMTLFIQADDSATNRKGMDLFLKSDTPSVAATTPLYIENAYQSGFKSVKLFIKGDGTLNNGYVYSGSTSLYIQRPTDNGFTLFVKGNSVASGVDMSVKGAFYQTAATTMVINGFAPSSTGTFSLYTHGPDILTSGVNLFITGQPLCSTGVSLYTHGF